MAGSRLLALCQTSNSTDLPLLVGFSWLRQVSGVGLEGTQPLASGALENPAFNNKAPLFCPSRKFTVLASVISGPRLIPSELQFTLAETEATLRQQGP